MKDATISSSVGYSSTGSLAPQGTASTSTLNDATVSQNGSVRGSWTFGTAALSVNQVIVQQRTVTTGGSETLNLNDGSLRNIMGETAPLTGIKMIQIAIIANPGTSTYASTATIGAAASNPNRLWFGTTTDTQSIDRYVPFVQGGGASKAVTAGACNVKIVNGDGSNQLTYLLVVGGTS